jgi:hypothetical protein
VFITLSLIFVISCASGALKQIEVDQWLNAKSGGEPSKIDITGRWRDAQGTGFFTWGEGYLRQKGNKVSGVIGDYKITGIVSAATVYFVFLHADTVYYMARLEMFQGSLTGNYFKAKDKELTRGYPTSFVKIVDPTKQ